MELEESTCPTSVSTIKPQSSRQYGTAQRQKYRSMEQNRKPRDKSTNLWSPYLRQRRQGYTMEKDIQWNITSGAGKTGQPLVKE